MEKRTLKVNSDQGIRLDLYLSKYNNDLSRSFIKNCIESNLVKVNGEVQYKSNYKVQLGDEIEISFNLPEKGLPKPKEMDLDVIYEDEDLIVLNKQAGIAVHPSTGNLNNTLVNGLIHRYKDIANVGDRIRAGLIHRLDKDTSGVILIGKTNTALWHYSKQFADRNVEKYYLAISGGKVPFDLRTKRSVTIRNYMGRNPKNRQKFGVVKNGGKLAESKIFYLSSDEQDKRHLMLIAPKTGRTHQIRVHLSSIGLPILGDKVYGGESFKRLMLHSYSLKIKLLNGEEKTFTAFPPNEFKEIFPNINGTANITKIK